MSSTTLNHMYLNEATGSVSYYAASGLTKLYFSTSKSSTIVPTESNFLTEPNVPVRVYAPGGCGKHEHGQTYTPIILVQN